MSDMNAPQDLSQLAAIMFEKANAFLETLLPLPPQRDMSAGNEYALFPFEHQNRQTFDYFAPSTRLFRGLPLRYMNPNQRKAAEELLEVSLSENGLRKIRQIRLLESVLTAREKANPNNPRFIVRDPEAHFVTIFASLTAAGNIDDQKPWSWRYEGHHVSLHWTIVGGELISSTPQFIGAQPAETKDGDPVFDILPIDTRVLQKQEDLARDLIDSLTDEQKQIARAEVPWDIETTTAHDALNERRPHRLEDGGNGVRGILYAVLTEAQKQTLWKLIEEHAAFQTTAVMKDRLQKIEAAGRDRIRLFLMNGLRRGDALYYRIRGDSFVIEYLNKAFTPSNGLADHQHSVWRDFDADWGRDATPHELL